MGYAPVMSLLSLLCRFLNRPVARPVTHTLVCGASRSGKSEAELARLLPLARRNDCAIVLMDPPGTLASKFLMHLHQLGLDDRVIYDRLADTDRVPGYEWLAPSDNPDALQREAENDERIREFASILLRRRGIQDPASTPLIEEGVLTALRLYIAQEARVPLPWLADVFDRGSEARAHLLAHCTDPALVRKLHEYAALSPTARRVEIGPPQRILRAVLTSPAFRVRSGGATFDLAQFLDETGILILDGSSRGNLSRDAASVMMGAIILRVIQHCRTGSRSRVMLVLDEAVNAGLIGAYESQALSETGKWGLEFHILIQSPFSFPSEDIRCSVLQNCWRHEWFRQGSPEAARLAAEDIAIPMLDPLKIHHTEYRIRTVDAGRETIQTTSRSEWVDASGRSGSSTNWNTGLWPRRREVRDAQERYTGLNDQILLIQKQLMLLASGYRFVRSDTVTSLPEYVPMLSDPRSVCEQPGKSMGQPAVGRLGEVKLRRAIEEMKRRSMFGPPASQFPPSLPPTSPQGAARKLAG